jgi:hypothetical protein
MSFFLALFLNEMADVKEQGACVKFCFIVGKTTAVSVTNLMEDFQDITLHNA